MLMDTLLLAGGLALIFAFWLQFREGEIRLEYARLFAHVVIPIVALRIGLLFWFGLYSSISRHAGNYELMLIALADSIATAVIAILNAFTAVIPHLGTFPLDVGGGHLLRIPWGIVFNDWMLALISVAGVRFLRRELAWRLLQKKPEARRRVLIIGAGDTGEQVARDLARSTQGAYLPVAYVDPDPALVGMRIHGLPVAGKLEDLDKIIRQHRPDEIVIALQNATPRVLSEIVDRCRSARLEFKIVPPLTSVMSGRIEVSMLRPVEIEDLLGRAPVNLNEAGRPTYLAGKRVLITGGGGSIGQELCRQALAQSPASITLLGRGENSLFEALIELRGQAREAGVELSPIIGDIGDEALIAKLFDQTKPQIVFHAAAHKHVHFMETQPAEAVKNNIRGTMIVAEASAAAGVEKFVLISTDKAVRPTGFMGASKRAAEMVVSAFNAKSKGAFLSVRFGNVLGSRGSVIPTFRRQIERGGPVTVTHPEVTRYFMTTAEAVSLVIQAGAQGKGGELFVLDMGRPVRIADLARSLITLSGLEPDTDIAIEFTGLRPGEKLTEEIMTHDEGVTATETGKIFVTRNEGRPWEDLKPRLDRLFAAAEANDDQLIRVLLKELIPEFAPHEES